MAGKEWEGRQGVPLLVDHRGGRTRRQLIAFDVKFGLLRQLLLGSLIRVEDRRGSLAFPPVWRRGAVSGTGAVSSQTLLSGVISSDSVLWESLSVVADADSASDTRPEDCIAAVASF